MDKEKLLRILMWCEILFLAIFVILIVSNLHVNEDAVTIVLSLWTKICLLLDGALLFASAIARTVVKYKSGLIKYNAALATVCVIAGLFVVVAVYFFINIW